MWTISCSTPCSGVILGGRIGYVLFYGMPLWRGDWLYPLKIWEGGMSFHGGLLGVLTAAWRLRAASASATSSMCSTSPRRCPASACSSGASAISSTASSGAARPTCPGRCWCRIRTAARRRAPSLAALRGDARGPGAVHHHVDLHQPAATALCAVGAVSDLLFDCAHPGRIRARAGCGHRLPGVRLGHDGAAAVAADAAAGRVAVGRGLSAAYALRKFRSGCR